MKQTKRTRCLRKVVNFYTDGQGVQWEELECGHKVIRKQDAFGYTTAIRRDCRHCRRIARKERT